MPPEFWIVVTQYDEPPNERVHIGLPPQGPLVHEGACHTREDAVRIAGKLRGQYGWVCVVKVVPPKTFAEVMPDLLAAPVEIDPKGTL